MLTFLKRQYPLLKRNFSTSDDSLLAQRIQERTLLRLNGKDASVFLQGLMTNDMKHLEDGAPSMFTMFLDSRGRVKYEGLIYKMNDAETYMIECDKDAALPLRDHLLRYKVRKNVKIDCLEHELDVWTVVTESNFTEPTEVADYKKIKEVIKQNIPNLVITGDPRLSCLGLRVITPKNYDLSKGIGKDTNLKTKQQDFYKLLRYKLGVGEGVQELPSENCFPLEANGDYLHGISFQKGCYIGQELTARTHHTGVIRKRIMPLIFSREVKTNENGVPIFAAPDSSKSVGKLRGAEQNNGVALLRINEALKAKELVTLDAKCRTHRPFWWPKESEKHLRKE